MKSNLKIETGDNHRTVFLAGSINAQNSAGVAEKIESAADGWSEGRVILSLGAVDYVSSAALRIFMQLWQKARAENCELILAEPSADVREVLEMTGFHNIFRIAATLEDARN